tara:strand:- start:215 stop:442 length:228 start_codon:yes stop_codon:yes gene_type:complete
MDNEIQTPQHIFNLLLAENRELKSKNESLEDEINHIEDFFSRKLYHLNESWQKDYKSLEKKYIFLMKLYKKLDNN